MVTRFNSILFIMALLALLALLALSPCYADSFTASLSHNPIAINDTFQLTLRFEGQRPSDEPILDTLRQDFTISGVSQDQRVQIINGRYSGAYSWHVNLQAKRVGKVQIPAIKLGRYETSPIELEVLEEKVTPGQLERLSISINSDKSAAYVGEQIILTLKLKRRGDVQAGGLKLSEPFDYEQLGEARDYSSVENGIRFYNSELKLVVFSEKVGALKIPSIIYEGKVQDNNRRPNFSSFFNNYSTITTRSKPLILNIKEKPPSAPVNWLPSTNVTVTESWETDTMAFKQGQPVTWTIRVRAEGLKHESLPELEMPDINGIKWYPDQPQGETSKTDDGLVSFKIYKYALVPDTAGEIVLPQIQIPWWNVASDSPEVAELASRTIKVSAAPNEVSLGSPSPAQTSLNQASTNAADKTLSGQPLSIGDSTGSSEGVSQHWRLVSLMLFILWLATLVLFALPAWRQKRYHNQTIEDHNLSSQSALKALRRACTRGDRQEIKRALLTWGRSLFADQNNHQKILNLSQLANLVNDQYLVKELEQLEQALYSDHSSWNSENLIRAVDDYIKNQKEQVKTDQTTPVILNPSL